MSFLWGYEGDLFSSTDMFDEQVYMGTKFNTLRLSNMIIDMIDIEETLDIDSNNMVKPEFSMTSALVADFKNNLEGGNIGDGVQIEYIRFKRRKVGDLQWQTMIDIPFDKNIENYDLNDYYVKNGITYEYALVPVFQNQEGIGVSNSIMTKYFSLFLTGRNLNGDLCNYPLRFDLSLSDVTLNEDKTIVKTLSSQFPAFLCGSAKYYTGTVTCSLISPTTEKNLGKIDMNTENIYRESFEEFIHTGRPMLIRNHSFYLLGVLSEIKKTPIFGDDCAWGIWNYNFTFTQVDKADDIAILKKNLLTYDCDVS